MAMASESPIASCRTSCSSMDSGGGRWCARAAAARRMARPYDPSSSASRGTSGIRRLAARPDRGALEADVRGPAEEEGPELSRLVEQESTYVEGLTSTARCDLMRTMIVASLAQQNPPTTPPAHGWDCWPAMSRYATWPGR